MIKPRGALRNVKAYAPRYSSGKTQPLTNEKAAILLPTE
jgi:hypothetical protein